MGGPQERKFALGETVPLTRFLCMYTVSADQQDPKHQIGDPKFHNPSKFDCFSIAGGPNHPLVIGPGSSLGLHCQKTFKQISSNLVSQMSQRRLLASLQAPFLKEKKGVRFSALYLQQKRNLLVLDHSHQQMHRDWGLMSLNVDEHCLNMSADLLSDGCYIQKDVRDNSILWQMAIWWYSESIILKEMLPGESPSIYRTFINWKNLGDREIHEWEADDEEYGLSGPTIEDTSITQADLHSSVNPVAGEPSSAQSTSGDVSLAEPNQVSHPLVNSLASGCFVVMFNILNCPKSNPRTFKMAVIEDDGFKAMLDENTRNSDRLELDEYGDVLKKQSIIGQLHKDIVMERRFDTSTDGMSKTAFLNGDLQEEVYARLSSEEGSLWAKAGTKGVMTLILPQQKYGFVDLLTLLITNGVDRLKLDEDSWGFLLTKPFRGNGWAPLMYLTASRPDLLFARDHAGFQDSRRSYIGKCQFLEIDWLASHQRCKEARPSQQQRRNDIACLVVEHLKMEMEIPCSNKIKFITACSFSNDSFEDIMKAQVSVIKASATLNIQAFKIKKSVSISFRMTQVHKMAKDHMIYD
ncbi:hypothetical protein Tco_0301013 [Tanacetum coccineum]